MLNEFTYKSKEKWRSELIARRREITDKPERAACATRLILPMLKGNVMVYASIGTEISTERLITELRERPDVTVFAPYTVAGEITPRRVVKWSAPDNCGNLPNDCYASVRDEKARVQSIKIDYCVTPLLGFNGDGYRIGYGKGCYDKFFARCKTVKKIGFAFDAQSAEFTPTENDVPLDCCVTEKKVIYFRHESYCG